MPRMEELPPELVADAVAQAVVEAVSGGGDTEAIVSRALSDAKRRLGLTGANTPPARTASYGAASANPNGRHAPAAMGSGKALAGLNGKGGSVLTEVDVLDAVRNGQTELLVAVGTIVTALARDAASDAGLRLVEG